MPNTNEINFPNIEADKLWFLTKNDTTDNSQEDYDDISIYIENFKENIRTDLALSSWLLFIGGLLFLIPSYLLLGALSNHLPTWITQNNLNFFGIVLALAFLIAFLILWIFAHTPTKTLSKEESVTSKKVNLALDKTNYQLAEDISLIASVPLDTTRITEKHGNFAARIVCYEINLIFEKGAKYFKCTKRTIWESPAHNKASQVKNNTVVTEFQFHLPTKETVKRTKEATSREFKRIVWVAQVYNPSLNVNTCISIPVEDKNPAEFQFPISNSQSETEIMSKKLWSLKSRLKKNAKGNYTYKHSHKQELTSEGFAEITFWTFSIAGFVAIFFGLAIYFNLSTLPAWFTQNYWYIVLSIFVSLALILHKAFEANRRARAEKLEKLIDFADFHLLLKKENYQIGEHVDILVWRTFNVARAIETHNGFATRVTCYEVRRTKPTRSKKSMRSKWHNTMLWSSPSLHKIGKVKSDRLVTSFSFYLPSEIKRFIGEHKTNTQIWRRKKTKILWVIEVYEPDLDVYSYVPISITHP